jgi:hypothetical protein
MKISKKKLNRLIDERVERNLKRCVKKQRQLQKQLDEIYALLDDSSARRRTPTPGRRFEEYED